jgi:hypothetical protein
VLLYVVFIDRKPFREANFHAMSKALIARLIHRDGCQCRVSSFIDETVFSSGVPWCECR